MPLGSKGAGVMLAIVLAGLLPALARGEPPIAFEDVTKQRGLAQHLEGWHFGHGGAWGDVTGNGRPDLYIGAFSGRPVYGDPDAPLPAMLFLNEADGFTLSPDEIIRFDHRGQPREERARISMALFVDLDNNGKLDLLAGTHSGPDSRLFENRWPHAFRDVTPGQNDEHWPRDFHMRNATAIDLDQDGLLDLIFIDGRYRDDKPRRVRALRNLGDFKFEDVSEKYGFMAAGDTRGLGSAVGDVNDDGRLDLFVADSNRLFIANEEGVYHEYKPGSFREHKFNDWPCGAAFADLTGNGLLDLVFTVHAQPAQIFVYINRGLDGDGLPIFEDVSEAAGVNMDFESTPVRGAQLALLDLDHDGRRDLLLAMVRQDAQGRRRPLVLRNVGVNEQGVPQFEAPAVDDRPAEVTTPYGLIGYYATAPVADFDRDGRMDIFMATWALELGSTLFRNVTEGGNYLLVSVEGKADDLNTMGIGATVRLYEVGHAGDGDHLLGRGDITIGNGYSSGDEALAHFGLGEAERCDVVVTWQEYEVTLRDVTVNQHLRVAMGGTPDGKKVR